MISNILQRIAVKNAIKPELNDGTAIVGATIDRLGYEDCYVHINNVASTGTPTTAVAAITIYHGDASNMSDEALFLTLAAAQDVKAAQDLQYPISLRGMKRYFRVKLDITYADGTSPKNQITSVAVLGCKNIEPAVASEIILGR